MFKTTCDCCLAVQSDRIFFVWAPCRGAGHSNAAPHSAKCHCRNSSCVDCDRSASWWQVGMGPAGYALQCGAGCGEAARAPGCGVHATAGKPLGGGREAARAGQMVCYGFSFRLSVRVRTVCFVLVTCALDLLMAALRTDYCTFNSTR
ncbi:unnamed protein product [Prorocentrum cordatum]|uniref:Uncharacterized protein n=1 Tax=Prorocentrum cordatum TaxID=2364126 RepID=A0ABN9PX27_9DINO|nr:unnamed protein product [Polarella glacialis]